MTGSKTSEPGGARGQDPHELAPSRLLLVSDDPDERALILDMVDDARRAGMPLGELSLDTAGDYRQALLLATDFDYGAVLLGRVGSLDESIRWLERARADGQLSGPFLLLSASADPAATRRAIDAGASDLLPRDELTAGVLERALRYALSLDRARSRAAGLELFAGTTGLARQSLFWEVLALAVRRARRNKDFLGVLMLHLDCQEKPSFKPGVDPIATVMPLVSRRLVRALRASDTISLLDDGDLAILVESMPRVEDMQIVAEKIIAAAAGRYEAESRVFDVTINVGIAMFPTSARDADDLVRCATAATLAAREKGANEFHFG